jgi:micrococcal nuclease
MIRSWSPTMMAILGGRSIDRRSNEAYPGAMKRVLILLCAAATIAAAPAKKPVKVYRQHVIHISDGDTFDVDIMVMGEPTRIRLAGVDTPEKGVYAHCAEEDAAGHRATDFTAALFARGGGIVYLRGGKRDLYNRHLATAQVIIDHKRIDLSTALIQSGNALPYGGGTKADWCARLRAAP